MEDASEDFQVSEDELLDDVRMEAAVAASMVLINMVLTNTAIGCIKRRV